tara:strand:+ start:442 stop:588 length:147 start_codon:yes stop_codon:yes gene_type:complete
MYGVNLKNGINEASPKFKILKLPGISHKKVPVMIRKTIMVINPIIELR